MCEAAFQEEMIVDIKWFHTEEGEILPTEEPLIAALAVDGSHAIAALLDEGVEHSVLLRQVMGTDRDIDKYFRIVFDGSGADWTFVCPMTYKGITNKQKRIEQFYKDGIDTIIAFLRQLGYPEIVEIPKRYRRHMDYLVNQSL